MKTGLLPILFIAFSIQLNAQVSEEKINQTIEGLSLEEKVYLVLGTGMNIPGMTEAGKAPSATVGVNSDKIPGAAGTSYTNSRLGFPAIVFADGPAGIRISPKRESEPNKTFYATAFPIGTNLASSWNIDVVNSVGEAFGNEGKEYGVDFLLAPALNIQRNPLGGRNFEYYSEDPVLGGKITAAFVNGVQSQGIGATIKHFVANNSETNRMELNTVVSERALREIYLKGFEIALQESKPWSVMSSYNRINGVYASENEELLTTILRKEWGYDGFVMTDWFAGKDAVAQMKAGNDLLMPGTNVQSKAILDAVKNGSLDEKILDRNIKSILKQYYKTPSFKNYQPSSLPDLEGHKTVARNAASEGMILLKNNNALPISKKLNIALFGNTSYESISGGTGSGDVNKAYMVSVFEGLNNAEFKLDKSLLAAYELYISGEKAKIPPKKFFFEKDVLISEKSWTAEEIEVIANTNDVAIFTLGRTSGEFQDRNVEGDFTLTKNELSLIENLSTIFKSKNKKFIVILNIGGVIETVNWKNLPDAILLAWQAGQEQGNAIADIISGDINPSGKLTVTFPKALTDVASSKNFPGKVINPDAPKSQNIMSSEPSEEVYEEGIYVGYRYFEAFNIEPSFPFGFGLSYTQFEYSKMTITKKNDELIITCTIKNTGKAAGKEIVQLYVASPKGAIEKPIKELKGFSKTKLLNSGESQLISIKSNVNNFGYYDTATHSWKLDKGTYNLILASNVSSTKLNKSLVLKSKTISQTQKALSPTIKINELKK